MSKTLIWGLIVFAIVAALSIGLLAGCTSTFQETGQPSGIELDIDAPKKAKPKPAKPAPAPKAKTGGKR